MCQNSRCREILNAIRQELLRTVPTIVIAQIMFCVSRETINIPMGDTYYKCKDIYGGLTLCGVLLVSKKRIWVTMHFSEIIKLQFGKEHHTIHCTLKLFLQILLINYL